MAPPKVVNGQQHYLQCKARRRSTHGQDQLPPPRRCCTIGKLALVALESTFWFHMQLQMTTTFTQLVMPPINQGSIPRKSEHYLPACQSTKHKPIQQHSRKSLFAKIPNLNQYSSIQERVRQSQLQRENSHLCKRKLGA